MAMLAIVLTLAYPSLRGFFRGRVIDSEACRLFALTRYGQNRAVAEGVPMILWLDMEQGVYGLEAVEGFVEEDDRAAAYTADSKVSFEAATPAARTAYGPPGVFGVQTTTSSSSLRSTAQSVGTGDRNQVVIRFLPDGYLGEESPAWILLREGEEENRANERWLVQSTNRLYYAIQSDPPAGVRR